MILARIEASLEAHQPEEQHGFRKHRRMDEHLLTATLLLDKAWDKGIPVWIVSLDLSKAFDRATWNALWLALHDHGISDHLVWILQLGEVQGEHSNSDPCPIHSGVRQGCVLSPRLLFFFFLAPFSASSGLLSKGLFYWSVSRLVEGGLEKAKSKPKLLRRGLAGGWRWGRGGVPRRALG